MSAHIEWLDAGSTEAGVGPVAGGLDGELALYLTIGDGAAITGTKAEVLELLQHLVETVERDWPAEADAVGDRAPAGYDESDFAEDR